ncbi:hypothetical protein EYZ11_003562 [Aspergillus tanneri]|uniref:Uncharacterized protein n=1 Tax=Aspergillus tanneri TaxID=1220188 RepID=A0A4V3UPY6_9EURO|nr:hypothetical protein EYZ11_003562 [Aspergillus tanneri]
MDFGTLVEMAARTDDLTYIWFPDDICNKYLLASDVIQTETDRKARKNGNIAVERHQQLQEERRNQISVDGRKNTRWGLVCFHTSFHDYAAWRHFQEQFTAAVDLSYFQQLRDENKIEPGLRYNTILYANQAAIQSSLDHFPLPERGFVVAADPSHNQSKLPSYLHGVEGEVRVALTVVLLVPTLDCFHGGYDRAGT